jgi:DNA-binding CsgD family transcriptional regulator/tetratricopeptide (TPR) repeat protein
MAGSHLRKAIVMAQLLERERPLAELDACLGEASDGHGRLILIGGEAGIGKSVLVDTFCDTHRRSARILAGACDSLSTPRPLGPLVDIARQTGGELRQLLATGSARDPVFDALLDEIVHCSKPSILVFEDIHWADEATLDLLTLLSRRLEHLRALLIATYRDDELGPRHPLRIVLGDLATSQAVRRLSLSPLTEAAIRTLAGGSSFDPALLHRYTGGNPFFITELLAAGDHGIPATVRDAVLARTARLPGQARAALEAAAVIGFRSESRLLTALLGSDAPAIDDCISAGVLRAEPAAFAFRHELTREAVLAATPPQRLLSLHRLVLEALQPAADDADVLARLAHHAEMAGDRQAVLKYAPGAARRAEALRAHRESAAQYARALRWMNESDSLERAALLEGLAYQCFLTDRHDEAVDAWNDALAIYRRAGDTRKEGEILSRLARPLWYLTRNPEAEAAATAALRVLEPLSPGLELGWAYSELGRLRMLAYQHEAAIDWAGKALSIAEPLNDAGLLAHALNSRGVARIGLGNPSGRDDLERSLRVALEAKLEDQAGRAYSNLVYVTLAEFQTTLTEKWMEEGIAYTLDHDVETYRLCLLAWRPLLLFYQGRWSEATDIAEALLRQRELSPLYRLQALLALGRVRARRGDPEADDALDPALAIACPRVDLDRRARLRAARAEAAWLAGDRSRAAAEAHAEYAAVMAAGDRWLTGELAFWLWRTGELPAVPHVAEPFAQQIAGDWAGAAASWQALGCPYEAARALADSCDESTLRQALVEFNRLGARPMVTTVTRKLRELGVRTIARGPRPTTRANPAQLTSREMEIWRLLPEGLRNVEIADRLSLSPKTVDHHISSILMKLGVRSRIEAAQAFLHSDDVQHREFSSPR